MGVVDLRRDLELEGVEGILGESWGVGCMGMGGMGMGGEEGGKRDVSAGESVVSCESGCGSGVGIEIAVG